MRIAVTGGLGFIGQEIVSRLLLEGHSVTIVDYWQSLIPRYEENGFPILRDAYRTMSRCDVIDPDAFINDHCSYTKVYDAIVHAGAEVDTRDMGADGVLWMRNVEYVRNLSYTHKVPLVFLSSAATYGTHGYPNNPYGLSKSLAETILMEHGAPCSILRLFNVFGRNEHHKGDMASVVWKLAQAYKNGDTFNLHSPDACRDFVPVDNVVAAVIDEIAAIRRDERKRVHDVGTGVPMSFSDVDLRIMQTVGERFTRTKIVPMPSAYEGRYQGFTCAGTNHVSVIGGPMTTIQGIEAYYGK